MAYLSLNYHIIFATKDRRLLIQESIQPRLWAYMGGIAKSNGFKALEVGGMEDHAHVLLALPATITVAKAVQLIKAGSSKWLRQELGKKLFTWQESYGAFTIGISQVEDTKRYIKNQKEHHRGRDFRSEWKMILERHGLEEYEK
jgi:putative transposase